MAKIVCKDLKKSYDGKTEVLAGINLEIQEGEFFILVGPSGCGKSTLLRIIAGLEGVSAGELIMDGQLANEMLPKDRNLTMVFQSYALYPHLSVRDNILFGLDVKKVAKDEQERRLAEAAELLGLTDYLDRKPRALSGGQRQRVALARSVCSQAPLCLMDEPLSNGRIQQLGTPLELYNHPANEFVATFIGTPQMNMAIAEVLPEGLVLNDDVVVPLSAEDRAKFPAGTRWKVGFRPEQVYPATATSVHQVDVSVVSSEMMGNETLIFFNVGTKLFTARWQGQHRVKIGATLRVSLDPRYAHFFDVNTGALVRAAEDLDEQGARSTSVVDESLAARMEAAPAAPMA